MSAIPVFWPNCLAQFEKELPAQQFITWIKPLAIQSENSDVIALVAPNRFVMQWVRDRFQTRIQELAAAHYGKPVPVELSLSERHAEHSAAHGTSTTL